MSTNKEKSTKSSSRATSSCPSQGSVSKLASPRNAQTLKVPVEGASKPASPVTARTSQHDKKSDKQSSHASGPTTRSSAVAELPGGLKRLVQQRPASQSNHIYIQGGISMTESRIYLKVKRSLCRLSEQLAPSSPHPTGSHQDLERQRTRLPELAVPRFSEEYLKWPEFKALFQTVIADRKDLSDLEKYQYLKSGLSGAAAQLIANIPPVGESFPVAWQRLESRFENHRLTVKSHLDRVFNLQPLKTRNVTALQRVVDTVRETIQALKALQIQSTSDCVLVHFVSSLLDPDTREQWELTLGDTQEYPKLNHLTNFLTTRLRVLESVEATSTASSHTSKSSSPRPARRVTAPSCSIGFSSGQHLKVSRLSL